MPCDEGSAGACAAPPGVLIHLGCFDRGSPPSCSPFRRSSSRARAVPPSATVRVGEPSPSSALLPRVRSRHGRLTSAWGACPRCAAIHARAGPAAGRSTACLPIRMRRRIFEASLNARRARAERSRRGIRTNASMASSASRDRVSRSIVGRASGAGAACRSPARWRTEPATRSTGRASALHAARKGLPAPTDRRAARSRSTSASASSRSASREIPAARSSVRPDARVPSSRATRCRSSAPPTEGGEQAISRGTSRDRARTASSSGGFASASCPSCARSRSRCRACV